MTMQRLDIHNTYISDAACQHAMELLSHGYGVVRAEEKMIQDGWDKPTASGAITKALERRDSQTSIRAKLIFWLIWIGLDLLIIYILVEPIPVFMMNTHMSTLLLKLFLKIILLGSVIAKLVRQLI